MKKLKIISSIIIILALYSFDNQQKNYKSDTLQIETLTENVWVHTSYLQTTDYGNVGCNGMIYKNKNEAIIFDTPTTDSVSLELINWVETKLKCKVIGVVSTHFHVDCLGGLAAFHNKNITSYANELTIQFAKAYKSEIPQKALHQKDEITVGSSRITTTFLGEGHSKDNIVGYIPAENILFGGCLIKEKGAKKGYLGDANVAEWSNTINKVKTEFPKLKWVIPGHGQAGGTNLLDYTINLFKVNND